MHSNKRIAIHLLASAALALAACTSTHSEATSAPSTPDTAVRHVEFVADSAKAYVDTQCAFGPRVPGTPAHSQCAQWLQQQLTRWCDTVYAQHAQVTTFDGTRLNITNLVGAVNPAAQKRLLIVAHWDCRPWADQDPDPARRREPVMGANDAASGVAVMLELARIMHAQRPEVGVDLLMTDAEDWGQENDDDSWALGTQHWAAHPHVEGYQPAFAILLDMVGARGAQFAPEYFSTQYAPSAVTLVWDTARQAGYANFFVNRSGGAVTDDHVPINRAGIPCIDIIDMRGDGFFSGWHTTHDTPDVIDSSTLKAVGQTLASLIYNY